MKVRFVRFFRFLKIRTQEDKESKILLEIPCKRMLLKLSPAEAEQLYTALDEAYTRVKGRGIVEVALPKVEEFTELTNLEMLMGYDRGDGITESAEPPQSILRETPYGVTFTDTQGFDHFVKAIQQYIDKKVKEEMARAKGDLV